MKYYVNETCIGCGMCCGVCPNVFSMNEAGLAEAIEQDIDPADEAEAENARDNCPVAAIELL